MFHNRGNNSKLNRLHKSCLSIIYSDKQSSNGALLGKNGPVSVHNRNFQILATEMYKLKSIKYKVLSSPIIMELLKPAEKQHYNLRNNAEFTIPVIKSVYHGPESISFLGPKIWDNLPDRLKNVSGLDLFKSEI